MRKPCSPLRTSPRFASAERSGRAQRRFALCGIVATLALASCGAERPRERVERPWLRNALIPVQTVPNVVSATMIFAFGPFVDAAKGEEVGSLAPLAVAFSPVLGLYAGVSAAVDGVPCWELFHPAPGRG